MQDDVKNEKNLEENYENQNELKDGTGDVSSKETVGDILRKERITRRISLETIAKDLKINPKYIKAIESNNFTDLPAEPYVRVYIRSIAKYLMLDPDKVLKAYLKEKEDAELLDDNNNPIKVSLKEDQEKKVNKWLIVVIIIVALIAITYLVNNNKNLLQYDNNIETEVTTDSIYLSTEEEDSVIETLIPPLDSTTGADSLKKDSLSLENNIDKEDNNKVIAEVDTLRKYKKGKMHLVINVKKDSVWVHVFSDGKSWKNFIKEGMPKAFYASDSFNINVGNNSNIEYYLNGTILPVPGKGVKYFKIDKNGELKLWKYSKWKKVFSGRL